MKSPEGLQQLGFGCLRDLGEHFPRVGEQREYKVEEALELKMVPPQMTLNLEEEQEVR